MRTLTAAECQDWAARSGVSLEAEGTDRLFVMTDGVDTTHNDLCRDLLVWLPQDRERLLWVHDFTPSPDQVHLFETLRQEGGLRETPGHLFPADDDDATALWLVALIVKWGWEAVLVIPDSLERLTFGEGYIQVHSAESGRLAEIEVLADSHGLQTLPSLPWL